MAAGSSTPRPTLDEIKKWPATVPVTQAATALGISRAYAYRLIADGSLQVRVVRMGRRIVVVTESLVNLLKEETVAARP